MKRRKGVPLHKYGIFFVFILCLAGMCSLCVSADDHTEKKEKAEYIQNEDVEVFVEESTQGDPDEENFGDVIADGTEEEIWVEEDSQNEEEEQEELEAETSREEDSEEIEEEPELLSNGHTELFTDGRNSKNSGKNTIIYENGIHYIEDPQYPGYRILLYCMNNELNWPHHMDGLGQSQVPGYTEGYLKPDMFQSEKEYNACMERLARLLYIGYPYNGERMYKIVSDSERYVPTEEEFDKMLMPLPVLQEAFPELGRHVFSYRDWKNNDKEHLNILAQFIRQVEKLRHEGTTINGLKYEEITAMPFYKAAWSMVWGTDATQLAIWRLLNYYHIPGNNIEDGELNNSELGKVLYTYSEKGKVLDHEPSTSELKLEADLLFRYNAKDGMYHSGDIRIIEPENYHGIYHLILPRDVTAQCDNMTYVYGNEDYQLVASEPPTDGADFGIESDFVWLEEFKQYSPEPDIEVNGKKYQHMIGAVIRNTSIHARIPYDASEEGGLQITKQVIKDDSMDREFAFRLELPYYKLNGIYGDMIFYEGIAEFTLKSGETKKAIHLPADAQYFVTEIDTGEYKIDSVNASGRVLKNTISEVCFTNTRLPDLILSKEVTGEAGNKAQSFHFEITLKDAEGNPVNAAFGYRGSIKDGYQNLGIAKPQDGKLEFKDEKAEIALSHGQQVTIKNLPYKSSYTVIEKEAGEDHYNTTYNGNNSSASGVLEQETQIHVVNRKEFVPDTGIMENDSSKTVWGIAVALTGILLLVGNMVLKKRMKK